MKNISKGLMIVSILLLSMVSKMTAQQKPNTALLIIDVQNDYFPGGKMELSGAEKAGKKTKQLLDYYRKNNLPIIHIKHIANQGGATFFLPNTLGAEIHSIVKPNKGEKVIVKHYPNSFRETDLLAYLESENIKNLVITGMMTDVCVDATIRAAWDYGFNNTVIGDATATRDRVLYEKTVKADDIQKSFLAGVSALNSLYATVITAEGYIPR